MLTSAPTSRAVDLNIDRQCQYECCRRTCKYTDCCIGGKARREELEGRHYMDRLDGIQREDLRTAAELLCYAPHASPLNPLDDEQEEGIRKAEQDVHRFILGLVGTATSDPVEFHNICNRMTMPLAIMVEAMKFFGQIDCGWRSYSWRFDPKSWTGDPYPQRNIIEAAILLGDVLAGHIPFEKDGDA